MMPLVPTDAIEHAWFCRPATQVAPELIGCTLVRRWPDGTHSRGLIVETEAYEPNDPACHAYRRRTARNAAMFGPPGTCYVYLIYGIYHCLNIVTEPDGVPSAVLIRALQFDTSPPGWTAPSPTALHRLAAGPGKLCRTLAIDRSLNETPLEPGQPLWLEHRSSDVQSLGQSIGLRKAPDAQKHFLIQTTRIGLTQGCDLPWRWYLADCPAVSKR